MKTTIILLALWAILVFMVIKAIDEVNANDLCVIKNGVYVQSMQGYVCVKPL